MKFNFLIGIFFTSFSLFSCGTAMGQKSDTVGYRIFYHFKHQIDTLHRDVYYEENMLLLVGNHSSLFTSQDHIELSREIKRQQAEQIKNFTGPGMPNFKYSNTRQVATIDNLVSFDEKTVYSKEFLIKNYLYEEKLPDLDWNIAGDTKSISGINCQLAKTTYGGRSWSVWFTPDIASPAGPWKLQGLPGLILDASDDTGEVQFSFSGIERVKISQSIEEGEKSDLDKCITFSLARLKGARIKKNELEKLRVAMYKNPKGFFMAQLSANGGFVDDETAMADFSFKNKVNNPIEKP